MRGGLGGSISVIVVRTSCDLSVTVLPLCRIDIPPPEFPLSHSFIFTFLVEIVRSKTRSAQQGENGGNCKATIEQTQE